MIKTLQRKFILSAMAAVTIVLVVIVGGINLVNYKNVRDYADVVLYSLSSNGGTFKIKPDDGLRDKGFSVETPFETRYFTVKFFDDLKVAVINVEYIASVDTAKAYDYASTALSENKEKGNIDEYRYLVCDTTDGKMVLFVDCSRQLATANTFLKSSITFSLCALAAVFILLSLISKRVMRPIIKSYEKQKAFITDASHELKTPLTIISANNEIIEMDYGENESTRAISKQISRMTAMTKNLTMLAKIDETDIVEDKEKFAFSDMVLDVVQPYRALAETENMRIMTDVAENIDYVGDESLMRQMFSLLLDNCIKYGKENINIKVSKVKKDIVAEIRNDAESVAEGNLDKCFERFYRSDESRASGVEGSGIGLSIAKEIVDLHKGKITAEGKNGEFIITVTL